jgi:hypothetical protein
LLAARWPNRVGQPAYEAFGFAIRSVHRCIRNGLGKLHIGL